MHNTFNNSSTVRDRSISMLELQFLQNEDSIESQPLEMGNLDNFYTLQGEVTLHTFNFRTTL